MKRFIILCLAIFFNFYANAEEKIEYYTNKNIKTRTTYEKEVIDWLQIGCYENGNVEKYEAYKNVKTAHANKIDSNIQKSGIDESKINYENAYIPAFNDFINLIEGKYVDDSERVLPLAKSGYTASIDNLSEFGYVYHDIDNNGIKELIITNSYAITSIYTLVSGVPKLLLEVNALQDLIMGITADGFIYRYGNASWANTYHWIENIVDGSTIVLVEEYSTYLDDDGKTIKYAKITPTKTTTISENEYDTEIDKYAKISMLDLPYSAICTKLLNFKMQAQTSNGKVSIVERRTNQIKK